MRRVVVTGIGMVSPLGCGADVTWSRILEGKSATKRITSTSRSMILRPRSLAKYHWAMVLMAASILMIGCCRKNSAKIDPFILYSVAAATQALDDADWHPETYEDPNLHRCNDWFRHWWLAGFSTNLFATGRSRPTQGIAILYPWPVDQSLLGTRFYSTRT